MRRPLSMMTALACAAALVFAAGCVSDPDPGPEGEEGQAGNGTESRFVTALDPPTADPEKPYNFDPSMLQTFERNPNAVLVLSYCPESGEANDTQNPDYCPGEAPPADCEASEDDRPPADADADRNRILDDFEDHLTTLDEGKRANAIVALQCPITWNDILDLREVHGDFPVNGLLTSGFLFADLTPEQVVSLTEWGNLHAIGGNRIVNER